MSFNRLASFVLQTSLCTRLKVTIQLFTLSGISRDLSAFQAGITEEMVKKAADKGTPYQIINNKLFRHKDCMFPAR